MKRPKLTLRDLFWLIFVAAILSAWYVDRVRMAERERAIIHWQMPVPGRVW